MALVAALYSAFWAIFYWQIDLTQPVWTLPIFPISIDISTPFTWLSLTFQIQPDNQPMLLTIYALATVAFALATRISQGHGFVPFTLAILAGYSAFYLLESGPISPPLLGPLFLVGFTCAGVFVFQLERLNRPQSGNASGPLRMLIPPALSVPLFLTAAWYIELIPLNLQAETTMDIAVTPTAGLLLAVGMLLLFAPVPLHVAQPAIAQVAPPVVTALLTILYQLALLFLFNRVIVPYPFVYEETALATWLMWAGIATATWAGAAAAGTKHPGRLWGYAALHDWGLIIMMTAVMPPSVRNWTLILSLFVLRAVSMFTAAVGLGIIERHVGNLEPESLTGVGNRLPWNTAAYLLGGLGLAGFPLSAGFAGHWSALQIIAGGNGWETATLILLASCGAMVGFVRMARLFFAPLNNYGVRPEGPISVIFALLMLLLSVSLSVVPQVLDAPITRILTAFSG
ncbi:MAG: proton-conducting transporter membrane subunit [Chloroflexota bacterium]